MSEMTEAKSTSVVIMKKTAIVTAAFGAIVLQVTVFRVIGDVTTSIFLLGLGYVAGRYLK